MTRHIGGRPSTRDEAWGRLLRYPGHWALCGYGYWALRETASGRFAGELGFADQKRGLGDDFDGAPEAGWALATWAHGRGYATEAMQAALAFADALGWPRTVCMIAPDNAPSLAVAARLGYRLMREASYRDQPSLLFQRPRPEAP